VFDGGAEIVVSATSVAAVDVTDGHRVPVEVDLPSRSLAESFRARVVFRCTVTDPPAVVKAGVRDLSERLRDYLESSLRGVVEDCTTAEITRARGQFLARIDRVCRFDAAAVPGVRIEVSAADLVTPEGLRRREDEKLQTLHRQDIERMTRDFIVENATLVESMMERGVDAVVAYAVGRGEVSAAKAAENMREDVQAWRAQVYDTIKLMAEQGHLDRARVDPDVLVRAIVEQIESPRGRAMRRGVFGDAIDTGRDATSIGPAPTAEARPAAEEPADTFPLDEDDE
jgi:hypothetical protein